MLRGLRNLRGWTIDGSDRRDAGIVEDFYLDDNQWRIRYLVVNVGRWGALQEILISPRAVNRIDPAETRFAASLTRAQIEQAPGADTRRPMARRYEREYASHFGYPTFWPSTGKVGEARPTLAQQAAELAARVAPADDEEAHLRSAQELIGYRVQAIDGESGHLEDFFADEAWVVRYFTVHTGHWLGRTVLLPCEKIRSIDWAHQLVHVDLLRDDIGRSPAYHSGMTLN